MAFNADAKLRPRGAGNNPKATCAVCALLFREPKLLPCLHTFCAECISRLELFSGQGSKGSCVTLLCPVCDTEVSLPPTGVDGLTTDQLAANEVLLESLLREECELVCDLCGEEGAERRCQVCGVNLCSFCCQAHRRQKKTASHRTVRLQDLKGTSKIVKPVLCMVHPTEEVRLFCETCDQPVCRDCVVAGHREHSCEYAADIIHKHGDYVRELVKCVQPHISVLEGALGDIEQMHSTIEARANALSIDIQTFTDGYIKSIEKHRNDLLKQLHDLQFQKSNQLHLQRIQLEHILSDVRTGVDFTERLLANGSDLEILMIKSVPIGRLQRLLEVKYNPIPVVDDTIRFLPQERAEDRDGYRMYGVIQSKEVDPFKCVIRGEGFQMGRQDHLTEFTLICIDSSGEQMERGGENVRVGIVHKEKKESHIKPSILDNNDGSYCITLTPQEVGTYTVSVCVKGQHVQGSPFNLVVRSKIRRHKGVFHCCTFCSSGGQKDARCGCGGTMPGGYQGCGHGHKGHPGKKHWSCCGNLIEGSECTWGISGLECDRNHLRTVAL
ncbi:tripartite motif-containing protein 45 isoform X2 [Polypterus senegalus]|uniref:tripartite motif-containing protein 45 isoform X2 n=1 Tax=Polypterus senegalus TaxID=55291 RepID=UPI0019657B3C|nr:tripartite motif-containing protein 45 isoform X2 [Polypterus senegalus]